jgi:hypothetical protein
MDPLLLPGRLRGSARPYDPQTCVRILGASVFEVKRRTRIPMGKNPGNNDRLRPFTGPSALTNTGARDCYAAALPARDDQDPGLLGNLPNRRPSVQSPRRAEARRGAEARRAAAEQPAPAPEPAAGGAGIEDLARAGVGLAAEAAGVGIKLAGRALGGIGRLTGRG